MLQNDEYKTSLQLDLGEISFIADITMFDRVKFVCLFYCVTFLVRKKKKRLGVKYRCYRRKNGCQKVLPPRTL